LTSDFLVLFDVQEKFLSLHGLWRILHGSFSSARRGLLKLSLKETLMTSAARFVCISLAALLAPFAENASPAFGVEYVGQMTFGVNSGPPIDPPFAGTYSFDTESTRNFFDSGQRYYLLISSVTITGGDSGNGGSYVIDPGPTLPRINYLIDGTPESIGLFLRNEVLNTTIVINSNAPPPLDQWTHGQNSTGIRGGSFSFTAPTLPAVPEPGTFITVALGVVGICHLKDKANRIAHRPQPSETSHGD
jgi:hypothetical protein